MQTIAVIDYGMGNLRSVSKALEHVVGKDARVVVTDDHALVKQADRIVVPGQGAAEDCMQQLSAHGMLDDVKDAYRNKPFLGICMGLQVLFDKSEENQGTPCLGLVPGRVKAFSNPLMEAGTDTPLKVPHMGWNNVVQQPHPLWNGIDQGARFYFVHSYYVQPDDASYAVGHSQHGVEFTCAVAKENVFACQFHPEKSAKDGLKLLQNFVRWNP